MTTLPVGPAPALPGTAPAVPATAAAEGGDFLDLVRDFLAGSTAPAETEAELPAAEGEAGEAPPDAAVTSPLVALLAVTAHGAAAPGTARESAGTPSPGVPGRLPGPGGLDAGTPLPGVDPAVGVTTLVAGVDGTLTLSPGPGVGTGPVTASSTGVLHPEAPSSAGPPPVAPPSLSGPGATPAAAPTAGRPAPDAVATREPGAAASAPVGSSLAAGPVVSPQASSAVSSSVAPTGASPTGASPTGASPTGAAPVTGQVFPEVVRAGTAGNGTHRLTLRLAPEALGEVRVVLTVRDGAVQVRLSADVDARAALLAGAPELHRLLEQAGATDTQVLVRDTSGSAGGGDRSPDGRASSPRSFDHGSPLGSGSGDHQSSRDARTRPGTTATDGITAGADRPPAQSIARNRGAALDVTM